MSKRYCIERFFLLTLSGLSLLLLSPASAEGQDNFSNVIFYNFNPYAGPLSAEVNIPGKTRFGTGFVEFGSAGEAGGTFEGEPIPYDAWVEDTAGNRYSPFSIYRLKYVVAIPESRLVEAEGLTGSSWSPIVVNALALDVSLVYRGLNDTAIAAPPARKKSLTSAKPEIVSLLNSPYGVVQVALPEKDTAYWLLTGRNLMHVSDFHDTIAVGQFGGPGGIWAIRLETQSDSARIRIVNATPRDGFRVTIEDQVPTFPGPFVAEKSRTIGSGAQRIHVEDEGITILDTVVDSWPHLFFDLVLLEDTEGNVSGVLIERLTSEAAALLQHEIPGPDRSYTYWAGRMRVIAAPFGRFSNGEIRFVDTSVRRPFYLPLSSTPLWSETTAGISAPPLQMVVADSAASPLLRYDFDPQKYDSVAYIVLGSDDGVDVLGYDVFDETEQSLRVLSRVAPIPGISVEPVLLTPNPADDAVSLHIREALTGRTRVRIVDLTGREVRCLDITSDVLNVRIDCRNIPTGMYVLLLENDGIARRATMFIIER